MVASRISDIDDVVVNSYKAGELQKISSVQG